MTDARKIPQQILFASISFLLILGVIPAKAQTTTTIIQPLSFGTFCPIGAGGTIGISPTGTRTVTGDVITINQTNTLYMQAIIEVEAPIGSRLVIANSNSQLRGSNGGGNDPSY